MINKIILASGKEKLKSAISEIKKQGEKDLGTLKDRF
jgi:hypothetical protein